MPHFILESNQYSERGDAVNARNIHLALKKYLGIDSVLAFNATSPNNRPKVLQSFIDDGIPIFGYGSQKELNDFARSHHITHSYLLKSGRYDHRWVADTKNCVHAVFNRQHEPHGDVYAYVSEWLYEQQLQHKEFWWPRRLARFKKIQRESGSPYFPSKKMPFSWVPHIVDPPKPRDPVAFRERLAISKGKKIIGRIGGHSEFNDPVALEAVSEILEAEESVFFVFVNTRQFVSHPRALFINEYISEQEKADFYAVCDLTLNCRLMGESFGFSICESLFYGIPVIGPGLARNAKMDAHHVSLLEPLDLLYDSKASLKEKIRQLLENKMSPDRLSAVVGKFAPEPVIKRFQEVFV